jgi:hypothetical protein
MKKHIYEGIILLLLSACGSKNDNQSPNVSVDTATVNVKSDTALLQSFIIPNHDILLFEKGDLNSDNVEDIALILKVKNEEDNQDALRPLLLITQNNNKEYTLAARNDSIVACRGCGGKMDPLAGISIKNGYITIEHEGGRREMWTRYITFHFDNTQKDWLLHRIDETSIDTFDPNSKQHSKKKTVDDFGIIPFKEYSFERMENQE